MGCGLGGLLASRGAQVAVLDHRPERAARIAAQGVRIEHEGGELGVRLPCSAAPQDFAGADLLLILVKAYSTRPALAHCAPCIAPHTAVLTLQNGLGNYEVIAESVPPAQVLAGTIVMGCALLGEGHVRISGVGGIVIGSPFGDTTRAEELASALRPFWPAIRTEHPIEAALWRKCIVNAAINPLSACTGLPNGALLEDPNLRELLGNIAREGAAVAQAAGIQPFDGDPVAAVEEVCRVTAGNRTSMLQDVTAGRRTEIHQICGEIVRRARAAGVQAPLCQAMVAVIASLEGRSAA
jgi:2-dehydropantoate 2-reductase